MHDSGEVNIPIGPQHPSLKEPESFLITLRGEKITDVNIKIGYNHRGIEKACEERTYIQDMYLIERICGICSHSH
ncbi:MAG: NADH dehydrogenase subunit, partial [Candidatus Omnitrophota bacterium]|nr:NADH dehydrogenase subunit [Candidatus Omnitrophota bacterium]